VNGISFISEHRLIIPLVLVSFGVIGGFSKVQEKIEIAFS